MKLNIQIFRSIVCAGLIGYAVVISSITNAESIEKGLVGVEVIEKEEIAGSEPMCKLHFQFISGVEQIARAKIISYQILNAKNLTFGMTGEKTIKPNSRSYVSPIMTKGACDEISSIAVERTKCDLIDRDKRVLGACSSELKLIDNNLVTFVDKRN